MPIHNSLVQNAERRILILQKVNDALDWGFNPTYLLMENPNPSDLDGDSSLDQEEKTGITDTSETLQIDKTFVWTEAEDLNLRNYVIRGMARAVASVSIARTGSTDGNIYLTKVVFDIGFVDSTGNFTSKKSANATPNFSTNSTSYQTVSAQAFLSLTPFGVPSDKRLALRVRCYGYKETTESGKMKLNCARGSADSYLEVFID